jgi:competence protein ComEA
MNNEVSARSTILAAIVIVLAIIAGAALLLSTRPTPIQITINPPAPTATLTPEPTVTPTETPAPILVYVTGAVLKPQSSLSLPAGSRVSDALEAAGGVTDDADLTRVNPTGVLHDGDQIHVPSLADAAASATEEPLPTPSGGVIIYINTATLEELQTLPGVGEALAQRIIDYREANGAFTGLADLDEVSGIGEAMLAKLEPLISFD